jgi:DNA-binding transcriptional LysR family regulator
MELRELRAFVAVADHGGVARAARVLYLSPSSVSNAVTSLESELGVSLFQRLPRGMVLTEVGRTVLAYARRALEDVAAAEAAAATGEGVISGRISIVPGRLLLTPVVAVVAEFHEEFPSIIISLRQPENGRVIADLVQKGEVDFGVMDSDSIAPDLEGSTLGTQTEAVAVPVTHPLSAHATLSFEDLNGVPMIVPPAASPFRSMFEHFCRVADVIPHAVAESDHLQTMLELVRFGVGATIVPIECATSMAGDGIRVIPLAPVTSRRVSLVARRNAERSAAAQSFWAFVQARRANEPT